MQFITVEIPGVVIIEPKVFEDARGFFMETFHAQRFRDHGLPDAFVQDNHSKSSQGVIRGLHYQIEHPQGKLVRAIQGTIFDVAVDLRRGSPTFGRSFSTILSAENRRQLYVPVGCAHGFCTVSPTCEIVYKCTDLYYPKHERTLLWNDPALGIAWPIADATLSDKDQRGLRLAEAGVYD